VRDPSPPVRIPEDQRQRVAIDRADKAHNARDGDQTGRRFQHAGPRGSLAFQSGSEDFEGAVDLGRGLAAFTESRTGTRRGRRVGFPRWKRKTRTTPSFRLRNKTSRTGRAAIRLGDNRIPRSVTLPTLGLIRVREDTRRLRRMITRGRAKILSATVIHRAGRWLVSVTVEAADLHDSHRHPPRAGDGTPWVQVEATIGEGFRRGTLSTP
jgi:hypothetical protein